MADDDTDGVIPESKIREAHAKCMEDPQLAKYFNDAPQGAKEYIALMFYCTVFQDEVDDGLYATYQKEVEEEMSREDLLYLATHDRNPQSKAHFRELLAKMAELKKKYGDLPVIGGGDLNESFDRSTTALGKAEKLPVPGPKNPS